MTEMSKKYTFGNTQTRALVMFTEPQDCKCALNVHVLHL